MALIKCPDCGKMFSEFAKYCPKCSCPIEDAKNANKPTNPLQLQDVECKAQEDTFPKEDVKDGKPDLNNDFKETNASVKYVLAVLLFIVWLLIGLAQYIYQIM